MLSGKGNFEHRKIILENIGRIARLDRFQKSVEIFIALPMQAAEIVDKFIVFPSMAVGLKKFIDPIRENLEMRWATHQLDVLAVGGALEPTDHVTWRSQMNEGGIVRCPGA